MPKQTDPRTIAIMDTLQDSPYPMSIAQLAEATTIPYPTLSRRLSVMVAEGTLVIDKKGGLNGKTLYYKIASGNSVTIKWMKGGTAVPEDMTILQAYKTAKAFPAQGAIDKHIERILVRYVEGALTETITADELADLRKELEGLRTILEDRASVMRAIQAAPIWTMQVIKAIFSPDVSKEDLHKILMGDM